MAHEISLLDQITTDQSTDKAWHGLDQQLDMNNMTATELAAKTKMGYEVECSQMHRFNGQEFIPIKNHFGVFAEGNEDCLQVVGERFNPVQPLQFVEWVHGVNHALKSRIVSAGTIRQRSYAFVSLDLADMSQDLGGDEIKKYLIFTISWDGKYPICCVAMDYRTVCGNTYPSIEYIDALGENGCLYYQKRHGKLNGAAIEAVVSKVLSIGKVNQEKANEVLGRLTQAKYDGENTRLINRFASIMADGKAIIERIVNIEQVSSPSFLDRCLNAIIDQEAWAKVKTAGMSNHANRIVAETMDGLGSDLETAKGTLWGMLNGYTYWTDHLSGREGEVRQENVTFGKYSEEKKNAILLLSAISNTPNIR